MKQLSVLLLISMFVYTRSYTQDFSSYGQVSDYELQLKECAFDKDANAVVLMHEAFSSYDDEHHLITMHHVRVKILKEQGISAANVSLDYYRKDDFEEIYSVEGMTINAIPTGGFQQTPLDRKSIFTKKTNERIGEIVFAFPAIKVGSIIDYKYTSRMKHYGGLDEWVFQERIPVLTSKYTLIILPNAEFAYRVNKTLDIPIVVKTLTSSGGVYFEMNNIPGLSDEPYIDARRDYLQKVIFQLSAIGSAWDKTKYSTSWNELNRELNLASEFGSQLSKNIDGTGDFIKQVKVLPSAEEKMKTVFNFVRSNMSWNQLYSKYSIDGIKNAWKKKTGTSGEINLLLINLLKEAELEVYPMLVSERFHGKVNTDYPFVDQFNSVFACVDINKRRYYLDATDKSTPPHITPSGILNTIAMLVKRKTGELITVTDSSIAYREDILARLELANDGTLSGDVLVKSSDYARLVKRDEYKENKEKFIKEYFEVPGTSLAVKEVTVANLENDSMSLDQSGKLNGTLNRTGEYLFLPLNLFTGFDANPFLAVNRFSNINFGFKRTINLSMEVRLPAGFSVDEMPKAVMLTNPDKDIIYRRQVLHDKSENTIRCMMSFQFAKSLYEADMYEMIREMYKRIFDYLKEPVVLKRL
ncbi:MAG: DUF3857 domain-containing protein [Ferruginibacter sp.]